MVYFTLTNTVEGYMHARVLLVGMPGDEEPRVTDAHPLHIPERDAFSSLTIKPFNAFSHVLFVYSGDFI